MTLNDTEVRVNKTGDTVEEFYESLERELSVVGLYQDSEMMVHYIMLAFTTVVLIYGVTSWCLIKSFRNYKNFVLISAIIANIYGIIVSLNSLCLPSTVLRLKTDVVFAVFGHFLVVYAVTVRHHWLVIICNMFYVDIAKVLSRHIRRRFMKSCVFGWVISFITSVIITISTYVHLVIYKSVTSFLNVTLFLISLPVILNCILYIVIVCSLFRSLSMREHSATNIRTRLYIATLIFILSDLILFSVYILKYIHYIASVSSFVLFCIQMFLHHFNPLLLNVYFVLVRSNREAWHEFYVNKLNEIQTNRDIQMNAQNFQETADGRSAVVNVLD